MLHKNKFQFAPQMGLTKLRFGDIIKDGGILFSESFFTGRWITMDDGGRCMSADSVPGGSRSWLNG